MPKKTYKLPTETITLTDDFIEYDACYAISPNEREIINDLFAEMQIHDIKTTTLKNLVKTYPENVVFNSLLATNYLSENKDLLAYNLATAVLDKYPDFLMAKQTLSTYFAKHNNYESIDNLFEGFVGCGKLLPGRKTITYFEYLIYVMEAVDFGFADENIEFVEEIADTLREIKPLNYAYEQILLQLDRDEIEAEFDEDIMEDGIFQIETDIDIPGSFDAIAPEFENPEVLLFYKKKFEPDSQEIRKFLLLPRESFIRDLIKVLQDLENRFLYFETKQYKGGKGMFIHVCNFIEALEAEEAIPDILLFLKNNEIFISNWVFPNQFSDLWSVLAIAGKNKCDDYVAFLFEPGLEPASKVVVLSALFQIQLHYPNKYKAVVDAYLTILDRINNQPLQPNVFNDFLLNTICEDALEQQYPPLTEAVQQFYNDPRFNPIFELPFQNMLEYAIEEANRDNSFDKKNIYIKYGDFPEHKNKFNWLDEFEDNKIAAVPKPKTSEQSPFKNISRNAKCPCGSGKKFKHCHGKFPDIINN